ncbi:hypothetical protein AHF37_04343 [Paragonimus kellicotti]|nr:hypothetical protein AHF37_04343 [Paragonimus kellicotti]
MVLFMWLIWRHTQVALTFPPTLFRELMKRKQEIVFYDTNMTEDMKQEVLLVVKQHYDKQSPDTSMHPTLMQLDETFGPRWTGRATTDVDGKTQKWDTLVTGLVV